MTPLDQVINSLRDEPEKWVQTDYTLNHKEKGVQIWTANIPYIFVEIYRPERKIGIIGKIKLQLAVNRWHKQPLVFTKTE